MLKNSEVAKMKEKIIEILKEIRPEFDFAESSDFIEDGYLDSFDIVTIIDELEKKFSVIIDGVEVIPENFCTVEAIEKLVNKSQKRV